MLTSTSASRGGASLARRIETIGGATVSEMHALFTRPGLLSFAVGLPAPECFPLESYRAASLQALSNDPGVLQYQLPCESLKRRLQELSASRGVNCRPDQIFLTTGAQQAIHLLVDLLLDPGQQVIFEDLTYEGLHWAIQSRQPEALIVPTTVGAGMNIDAVEAQLARGARPAFIYVITDGHNPLGVSLSQAARIRLVELARHFRVPIVEDDVFGFLSYDDPILTPMRALDEEWVFYIGSLSKILAPSLRVGWIVAPDAFRPHLSLLKYASDLDIATLAQFTASTYLDRGEFSAHLAALRKEYGIRRDTMLRALESYFPPEAQWKKPSSGMFIWVDLPQETDTVELLRLAVETEQVAFMPGQTFARFGHNCPRNGIRLNFTNCRPQHIEEGIMKLGRVLKKSLKHRT